MEIVGTGKRRIIGISALVLLVLFLHWLTFSVCTLTVAEAKERALQDDLWMMRSLIHTYTREQHQQPRSLHDLVAAGYIKHIPKDPMTGRADTWAVESSYDAAMPGIVNVRSGAAGNSSKGNKYADW